jgi:hypothetical protein
VPVLVIVLFDLRRRHGIVKDLHWGIPAANHDAKGTQVDHLFRAVLVHACIGGSGQDAVGKLPQCKRYYLHHVHLQRVRPCD